MSKRIVAKPDALYQNRLIAKLINRSMYDGKKNIASKHVYRALEILAEKTSKDALEVFRDAIENVKPQMEVRTRRIGGAAYQVPTPVKGDRKESLAVRWVVTAARNRNNHTYAEKLALELLDALNNEGGAVKKKLDTHKMAEANKAFAHFGW